MENRLFLGGLGGLVGEFREDTGNTKMELQGGRTLMSAQQKALLAEGQDVVRGQGAGPLWWSGM
jgi:hypothetical protein